MDKPFDTIVIGAGQAGLAAGYQLQRAGQRFAILEAGGEAEPVDSVIFATGFRPSLDYLAPLEALDADGQALHHHGVSTAVRGLGFVGFSNQRTFASAALRGVGADAAAVVRALQRQRKVGKTGVRSLWRAACCPAGTPAPTTARRRRSFCAGTCRAA
jgi:2-polyprenyl-6-methoxyphenol hydroxylase-like FAD-dependent oxidoreductase